MTILNKDSGQRYAAADGIRGLAVLIVLVIHSMFLFFPATYKPLAGSGKIGVWLFFSLSAFLLTNRFISNGYSLNNISAYIIGRVLRIIPIYVIALLIYVYFDYFPLEYAVKLFKLNQPWGHLWTVAVEFKFYFILPIVAALVIMSSKFYGAKGAIISSALLIIFHQSFYPYYKITPSSTDMMWYISSFVPGICCAALMSHHRTLGRKLSDLMLLIMLSGIIISIPGIRKMVLGIDENTYLLDKHVHFSVIWSAFIFICLTSNGITNKIFSCVPFRSLGKWSFSIYLFHWIVYTKATEVYSQSLPASVIFPIVAIFVGGVSFYMIEMPIEKIRHLIMRKISKGRE